MTMTRRDFIQRASAATAGLAALVALPWLADDASVFAEYERFVGFTSHIGAIGTWEPVEFDDLAPGNNFRRVGARDCWAATSWPTRCSWPAGTAPPPGVSNMSIECEPAPRVLTEGSLLA
mgnify:CR=1 FL=1